MLKKGISIILIILSIIIIFYDKKKIDDNNEKIENIINDKKINSEYDGYIYIPKINYKNIISKGNETEVLDKNIVLMVSNKEVFNNKYGNIILAGHNNKYVFNILYELSNNDEIIVSDFKNIYSFNVYKTEYVNIKKTDILDNVYDEKILTLITCTYDNQIRYVVTSKLNHIISHN